MTLLAQQPAEIAGTYVGRYICGRVIGMHLALESAGPGRVSGVFTFSNDGGTAANAIGAFRVAGTFDPQTRALRLQPGEWVKSAAGWTAIGLSGTYDPEASTIKGSIASASCTAFEVVREGASPTPGTRTPQQIAADRMRGIDPEHLKRIEARIRQDKERMGAPPAATSVAPEQTGSLRREAATSSETPDQKLQRLTTLINSPSASADARRQALRERAFLNATTGRLGFAHQDVDALLALDPRDPEAHFARGLAFFVGNPPQAVRAFSQVIEIEATKVDAYRGRAWANLVAGEYGAATKDFEQVMLLEPNDSEAYRGRGWAHLHGKNYDQAIKDFTELMRRSPGHPEASAVRGIAYYLSGRLREARADYRSTIRYGRSVPSGALTFNTLILDDWQRYRRVLALLAEKTDVDGLLASGVAGSGLPAFDQAVKISPDDVDARMLRALFQAVPIAGTGVPGYSPPSAITDLSEVIRLRPDHTEAYFWRAMLRAQAPEPKALLSAIEDCEKALSVSPGDPVVGALLQKLKIEQRAREQSAEQAAIARARFEQNKEAYAAAFLIALVAMFGSPREPPDPFRRSLLDDMRTWEHHFRPCVNSRGQRC
jgi:tetratricopeptide (TPR) repeat protein